MGRLVHAILPALTVFTLASGAAALPPERPAPGQPAPGQPDEATMRRLATSAPPPSLATARATLNAALSQRLRAAAATALNPIPPARPPVAVTPVATCTTAAAVTEVRGEPNGDGTVTPDNNLSIAGCHLGTTAGSATIVGPDWQAPLQLTLVPVCASPDFKNQISCWQDSAAVFHVPHLHRVGDSPATLVVALANGQTLKSPVNFVALRQTALVFGTPPIFGKCSHATNNDDCVTTQSGPLQVDSRPARPTTASSLSIRASAASMACAITMIIR